MANPDTVTAGFNTPVTIPVTGNDTDADGDTLTVTQIGGQPITAGGPGVPVVVGGVTEGTVTLDNAGHLVFTPAPGYSGPATFTYTVDDGHGGTSTASVNVAVDHPPVATGDTVTAGFNTPVTIPVLSNDTDPDGDPLTVTQVGGQPIAVGTPVTIVVGGVTEGTVSLGGDGQLTFTPAPGYSGPATFTYTVDDGHGGTSTATVNVAVDHPPVATPDTVSTDFGSPVTIPVLANDTDPDGDPLSITQVGGQPIAVGTPVTIVVGGVTEGTVTLGGDGQLTFTPAPGYSGPATFPYTVSDGHGGTATGTVTVNVDHPPVATPDTVSTDFGAPVTIPVLANDTDADGDPLTITQVNGIAITAGGPAVTVVVGGVTEGTVTLGTDGQLTFTPANGYTGPATFPYTVTDGHGGTATSNVTVNVDHPPVANDDVVSAGFNTPVTIPVLANDTDADGDTLTVTQVNGVAITAGGPAVTVVVGGVTEGTVTLGTDGQLTFTPATGYTGPATFPYTVTDGHGGTATGNVTVNVDHPPVANDDVVSAGFNTPVTIPVLANDTDADGDTLTVTQVNGVAITAGGPAVTVVVGGVTEGSVTLGTDGQLTFTPASGYTGPATFPYTVTDGHGGTSTGKRHGQRRPPAGGHRRHRGRRRQHAGHDRRPRQRHRRRRRQADRHASQRPRHHGRRPRRRPWSWVASPKAPSRSAPTASSRSRRSPATPAPRSFTYTIDDGHGGTSTATAQVSIDHVPVAVDDAKSTDYNTPVTIAVLANDTDADGDALTVTHVNGLAITAGGAAVTIVVGGVTEGSVTLDAAGNLTFTPAPGYTGPATFPVHRRRRPRRRGDGQRHRQRRPPAGGDGRLDVDQLQHGRHARRARQRHRRRSRRADHHAGQRPGHHGRRRGRDRGRRRRHRRHRVARHRRQADLHARHRLHRRGHVPVHDHGRPRRHLDRQRHHQRPTTRRSPTTMRPRPTSTRPSTLDVLANDTDADHDALTITQVNGLAITAGGPAVTVIVGGTTEGTVSLGTDGKLTFTPATGYTGAATFPYTITDGHGGTSTANVTINVDHPPVANDDIAAADAGQPVTIDVLANDTDADHDKLTITQVNGQPITAGGAAVAVVVGGNTEGSVTLGADGKLTFTPAPGYSGPAQFTYTIDDGHGGTSTATASVAIDHPPVAVADSVSTDFNTAVHDPGAGQRHRCGPRRTHRHAGQRPCDHRGRRLPSRWWSVASRKARSRSTRLAT